ncbi:MAG: N-acetylmuramoyl-L-alanine amidase [Bacteroidales bacterium]|nr:N-acetylmuramoyl-L-alanine amidase [Bacteroidales bacterium]
MRRGLLLIAFLAFAAPLRAQTPRSEDFKPAADSLTVLLNERFNVRSNIKVWKVMRRGNELDIYFERKLSDYPWRKEDTGWFRGRIRELWPEGLDKFRLGKVFCHKLSLDELVTPGPGDGKGKPQDYEFNYRSHRTGRPFVERLGRDHPRKGLYRRNIALWQSHGLYFDGAFWSWQRTPLFRTIEDLYTQSYVLPFLIPMLENAGAYVVTPRERDTQIHEIICDNDTHCPGDTLAGVGDWAFNFPEPLPSRTHGAYSQKGSWSKLDGGFADFRKYYSGNDNPFAAGTAVRAACVKGKATAEIRWTPEIPSRGSYAVYVSYKTVEGSTAAAHYTVNHLGGKTEFAVDQTRGGGTWIYLGTFEFDRGSDGCVVLDNATPKGREGGKYVTADAVRFGGGIGKVLRGAGDAPDSTWTVSGMPSYTEGALYWMHWAGAPQELWKKWEGDYTRDYAGRGAWVKWMKDSLGVNIDLSLALHSDAGVTPNDSTVGTLAIYTLLEKNSRKFSNKEDRMASRFLGDCIQTEVCDMIRSRYDSTWRRRQLWDRSYSECRTTDVPGIILEVLSHQNFADMKYGLDPQFRFDVSRSIYKGMLKFLSSYYGNNYAVQPLPVKGFRAEIVKGPSARLSWSPVTDTSEPTADPSSYLLYTRVDGGGWNNGISVRDTSFVVSLPVGKILSFKVVACNDGGDSFPSEILSVGIPSGESKGKVRIVNNFTRVSGPAFFDTPTYAGFDGALDSGVPWGTDISYIGEDYEHRRDNPYSGNNAPGFGGSDYGFAGRSYAGNSFDYPYIHGKALLDLGWSFESCSAEAFCSAGAGDASVVDLVCGKQVSTVLGSQEHGVSFRVFPEELQQALRTATGKGASLIVSGANIATEGWDSVYPVADSTFADYRRSVREFDRDVLGIRWISSRASRDGVFVSISGGEPLEFWNEWNGESYFVENPDGIRPKDNHGKLLYKYRCSNVGAAVQYQGSGYRAVSFGFPLETIKKPEDLRSVLEGALGFISSE